MTALLSSVPGIYSKKREINNKAIKLKLSTDEKKNLGKKITG